MAPSHHTHKIGTLSYWLYDGDKINVYSFYVCHPGTPWPIVQYVRMNRQTKKNYFS